MSTEEQLTRADVDQIIEGIEHFIISDDPAVLEIWQPYIDKLKALRAVLDTEGDRPDVDSLSDLIAQSLRRYGYANGETFDTLHAHLVADLRVVADTEGDQPTPAEIVKDMRDAGYPMHQSQVKARR